MTVEQVLQNGQRVAILPDKAEASEYAAWYLLEQLYPGEGNVIGVHCDTTSDLMWGHLADCATEFTKTRMYMLDEYAERVRGRWRLIHERRAVSLRGIMRERFFDYVPFAKDGFAGVYVPSGLNAIAPGVYDACIENAGGLDFLSLGVGQATGHFGFVRRGTPLYMGTHLSQLPEEDRAMNEELTGRKTPEYALTMGPRTVLDAWKLMVLACGERKAEVMRRIMHGKITPAVPASLLRLHHDCLWVMDEAAASRLEY